MYTALIYHSLFMGLHYICFSLLMFIFLLHCFSCPCAWIWWYLTHLSYYVDLQCICLSVIVFESTVQITYLLVYVSKVHWVICPCVQSFIVLNYLSLCVDLNYVDLVFERGDLEYTDLSVLVCKVNRLICPCVKMQSKLIYMPLCVNLQYFGLSILVCWSKVD